MIHMWIVCITGQWILTVLSVVHYIFTQSPSTVATVIDADILLGSHRDRRVLIPPLAVSLLAVSTALGMGHDYKQSSRSNL